MRKVVGMELTFETPPLPSTRGAGGGKYLTVIETLRARPGEWARIETGTKKPSSIAQAFKKGALHGISAGEFDAVTRKREDGTVGLWVRYIAPVEAATE